MREKYALGLATGWLAGLLVGCSGSSPENAGGEASGGSAGSESAHSGGARAAGGAIGLAGSSNLGGAPTGGTNTVTNNRGGAEAGGAKATGGIGGTPQAGSTTAGGTQFGGSSSGGSTPLTTVGGSIATGGKATAGQTALGGGGGSNTGGGATGATSPAAGVAGAKPLSTGGSISVAGSPSSFAGAAGSATTASGGFGAAAGAICSNANFPAVGGTGTVSGATLTVGDACSGSGTLACSGSNQKEALLCYLGTWQHRTTCDAQSNCDQRSGVCTPIAAACAAHEPGYLFCDGDTLTQCGSDRVTVTTIACCGKCQSNTCLPARCGDERVEPGEECDDGNAIPADGCELDCTKSVVQGLVAGQSHACVLLRSGRVRCWGGNDYGQLGLADAADHSAEQPYTLGPIQLGINATAIAAGANHTCVITANGSVQCWGRNDAGQLGLGHTRNIGDDEFPAPDATTVNLGQAATAIAAGRDSSCAILADQTVRCWGKNDFGQLGLGHTNNIGDDETPSKAAAEVSLGAAARLITVEGDLACAVTVPNVLRCWGRNDYGQLGLGDTVDASRLLPTARAPVALNPGNYSLVALSAGGWRTAALSDDGVVQYFGYNGDGGLCVGKIGGDPLKATDALYLWWGVPIHEVKVGGGHVCIRLQTHGLQCWGVNAKGQLGIDSTETLGDQIGDWLALEPDPINLGTSPAGTAEYATTIAAGALHTCVLLSSGRVRCWGHNAWGQLGLGYASSLPIDYVGGDATHTPDKLPVVQVFGSLP